MKIRGVYKIEVLIFLVFYFSIGCGENSTTEVDTAIGEQKIVFVKPKVSKAINSEIDISPMDMLYFPVDYPKEKMKNKIKTGAIMRVIYSRPHLQGRSLFSDIIAYGKPWRLGANEATEIEFFEPVKILGTGIPTGRYVLYAIPYKGSWDVIFSTNINSWGLEQDTTKNFKKFNIPVYNVEAQREYFTMQFLAQSPRVAVLEISWDNIMAKLPIEY